MTNADQAAAFRAAAESQREYNESFAPGINVIVTRGRKVPLGTEGVILWSGPTRYGMAVKFVEPGGMVHLVSVRNVEPTQWQPSIDRTE